MFGSDAVGWAYYGQGYAGTVATSYTDSASGTISLSGSATESRVFTDSASGTITLSGSGTDAFAVALEFPQGGFRPIRRAVRFRRYEDRAEGRIPLSGYAEESISPDPERQREEELILALA